MKKITLLFIFSIFCFVSNAQVLTEGFDAVAMPAGWTQTQITGTTSWITATTNGNSTVVPRTGARMARFSVGNYTSRTRLNTPALDLTTLSIPVLTFYYTNADWGGDTDELRVFYKTSAAGAWTLLATYTASQDAWTEVNIVLPDPSNDYYIGFEAKSNWGYALTLDDVLVDELSGCLPPGSLSVLPTSTTDADLSWVAAGSEGDWTYEYGATGYVQGTGALGGGSVMAETASITGLTAGTTYDFYVQANCGGTDGDSGFTGPYTWTQPDTGEACGTAIVATLEADCGTATPLTLDFSATTTSGGGSCDTFNNIGYWITTTTDAAGGLTINASAAVDVAIFSDCSGSEEACYGGGIAPSTDIVLLPNTQYYMYFWLEVGATSSIDICISSYTPAQAPECATTPFPADDATNVPVGNLTFTWTAPVSGPAPTSYNLYAYDDATGLNPFLIGNYLTESADLTINAYSTEIFWAAVPVNASTEATGCAVWSFTTEDAPPPPANNDCSGAITLTPGATFDVNPVDGTTVNATDSGLPVPCGTLIGPDVWYSVVVPGDGNITIEVGPDTATNTPGFDSVLEIFTGSCGSLTSIGCDDDTTGGYSLVDLTGLTPGETLYVRVFGYGGDEFEPFSVSAYSATLSLDNDQINNQFTYFPNPVKNTLNLRAQSNIQNVSVFNMLGQEVLRTAPNNVENDVDMSELQTGAYFVKVTINDRTETVRVIKQ